MKTFLIFLILFSNLVLWGNPKVLVDLIHGVDYCTDGDTETNNTINFSNLFQNYDVSILNRSSIEFDEIYYDDFFDQAQTITYDIDLPPLDDLDRIKTIYVVSEAIDHSFYDWISGSLINPEGEIVANMFNGVIHFDEASGSGWQVEVTLAYNCDFQIKVGYGDVLLGSNSNFGQVNLQDFDCAVRIVDNTYIAVGGIPSEYSLVDLYAFTEAFEDTLGFINCYNMQDIFIAKPFVHIDVPNDVDIDFDVYYNGHKTLAEPTPIIDKGHLSWRNFNAKKNTENEIVYEAAFNNKLNFIHFEVSDNAVVLQNQVNHSLDNLFIFTYEGNNKYKLFRTHELHANQDLQLKDYEIFSTAELRRILKNNFHENAIKNGLTEEESKHFVYDFVWIETLLKRSISFPDDYFGFYHFNDELYDKLIPYHVQPKPEQFTRNTWVLLSNIDNRELEPVINFPQTPSTDKNEEHLEDFYMKEYGVIDEYYSLKLSTREDLFNVQLGEFNYSEEMEAQVLTYSENDIADSVAYFIEFPLFMPNGYYSIIVDNPYINNLLHGVGLDEAAAALSFVGENGKVISFGTAFLFTQKQYMNNCADFLTNQPLELVEINENLQTLNYGNLYQNKPNPFVLNSGIRNNKTEIAFSVTKSSRVEIDVYNIKGQKIINLVNKDFSKGNHSVSWNGLNNEGKQVASSIYFITLKTDGRTTDVKKCVILK